MDWLHASFGLKESAEKATTALSAMIINPPHKGLTKLVQNPATGIYTCATTPGFNLLRSSLFSISIFDPRSKFMHRPLRRLEGVLAAIFIMFFFSVYYLAFTFIFHMSTHSEGVYSTGIHLMAHASEERKHMYINNYYR